MDTLNNELDDLNTRTKLTITDIHKLTELCLCKSYFLYENKIRLLENTGPIGLSLMVVLSESYFTTSGTQSSGRNPYYKNLTENI